MIVRPCYCPAEKVEQFSDLLRSEVRRLLAGVPVVSADRAQHVVRGVLPALVHVLGTATGVAIYCSALGAGFVCVFMATVLGATNAKQCGHFIQGPVIVLFAQDVFYLASQCCVLHVVTPLSLVVNQLTHSLNYIV